MGNILLEIYNKIILKESIDINSVTDSIKNKYRVTINYEGDPEHGIAPGLRTVEVYAYGLTKAGNPVIRAYQPYGDTVTTVPSWKFFRIDRIKSWKKTYSLVTKAAPGFNPNGDRSMSVVYTIADFNSTTDISNATGPKEPKIVGKLDNIEKILADREKEKQRNAEYKKTITNKSSNYKTNTTQVVQNNTQDNNKNNSNVNDSEGQNDVFKTDTEKDALAKIKDLNNRLDNARKIDLSKIK